MPQLVLASGSPYKQQLLRRLNISFTTAELTIDESSVKSTALSPGEAAALLAQAKALSGLSRFPGAVVIGSDQIVSLGGRIFSKPVTVPAAVAHLSELSGKTHQLISAVHICSRQKALAHAETSSLTMRALTQSQIERYVASDMPLDCAGSYKFEQSGISLFSKVETPDPSGIIGFPLIAITSLLIEFGFELP